MRRTHLAACAAVSAFVVAAPVAAASPPDVDSTRLEQLVTVKGITEHQKALQTIADLNGGTRYTRTPGYTASAWYGLLAPKGLPADIRAKLEAAAGEALQRPDVLERLKEDGATASGMRADAFATFMATERQRWGDVIRDANITLKE